MTEGATQQSVDPAVSKLKFDQEIKDFRALSKQYNSRGWFLVDAEFPHAFVVLATPQLQPAPIVTGVSFDYSNYDLEPPSVRLVNPFTHEPWTAMQLPTTLRRRPDGVGRPVPEFVGSRGMQEIMIMQEQSLMQSYPDGVPFLCVAGVREYHEHPAHSGDSWELHRPSGAGRLVRILEIVDKYGVRPVTGYSVALQPLVSGLIQGDPPA